MQISQDIQKRIIETAEQLYTDHPEKFPTVAEVRAISKADMNSVSTVMKQWRQSRLMPQRTIEEAAPSEIQDEAKALAATIWATAKAQAEQKLRDAEIQYMKEREEAEQLRLELSMECDALQKRLDQANDAADIALKAQQVAESALAQANAKIVHLEAEKKEAIYLESLATAKNTELEKHIVTLKADIEHNQTKANHEIGMYTQTINELRQTLNERDTILEQHKKQLEHEAQLTYQLQVQLKNEQQQTDEKLQGFALQIEQLQLSEKAWKDKFMEIDKTLAKTLSDLQTANAVTEQAKKHAQDLKVINEGLLKLNQ